MTRFVCVDRQTGYLLPPSVEDWFPDDQKMLKALADAQAKIEARAKERFEDGQKDYEGNRWAG
jgi:hypothetical protein